MSLYQAQIDSLLNQANEALEQVQFIYKSQLCALVMAQVLHLKNEKLRVNVAIERQRLYETANLFHALEAHMYIDGKEVSNFKNIFKDWLSNSFANNLHQNFKWQYECKPGELDHKELLNGLISSLFEDTRPLKKPLSNEEKKLVYVKVMEMLHHYCPYADLAMLES